jgi:hypothetical protein
VALALNAVLVNTGVTQLHVGRGPRLTVFNAHEHLRQAGRTGSRTVERASAFCSRAEARDNHGRRHVAGEERHR